MPSETPRLRLAAGLPASLNTDEVMRRCNALCDAGFDAVELSLVGDFDTDSLVNAAHIATLAQTVRNANLQIAGMTLDGSTHQHIGHHDAAIRTDAMATVLRMLDLAASIGASTVSLSAAAVLSDDGRQSIARYDDAYHFAASSLTGLRFEAATRCVRIAVRLCHRGFLTSPIDARELIDLVNSPWIGTRLDPASIVQIGAPCDWANALGHRVFAIDYTDALRGSSTTAPGDGGADWPGLTKIAVELGGGVYLAVGDATHHTAQTREWLDRRSAVAPI